MRATIGDGRGDPTPRGCNEARRRSRLHLAGSIAAVRLSLLARTVLALVALLAVVAYLVIVDLGVSAGRIHYGVSVSHVDVGGLTALEASAELDERARELEERPVIFEFEGIRRSFFPREVDWRPNSLENAQLAMRVGRAGGPLAALEQRIEAWIRGVEVPWQGSADGRKVGALMDGWESALEELGLEIRRPLLRSRIRRAIVTWPRRPFPIPVRNG